MPPVGAELYKDAKQKMSEGVQGGAKGGAVGGDLGEAGLAELLAAWPKLPDDVKAALLAIVRGNSKRRIP